MPILVVILLFSMLTLCTPFVNPYLKVRNFKSWSSDQEEVAQLRTSLFQGDVVEYQIPIELRSDNDKRTHSLAAITNNRKLQPLYRREAVDTLSDEILLFVDDDQGELTLSDPSIIIVALVDEFEYTQRIVEDRVSNPHGEHAEDVWILRDASVIKSIIEKPDLFLRLGPAQH